MLVFDFSCMNGFVLAPPWLLLELGIWFGLVSVGAQSHYFASSGGGYFLVTTSSRFYCRTLLWKEISQTYNHCRVRKLATEIILFSREAGKKAGRK